MGEAKRRKISGDYPSTQRKEEPVLDLPDGRKVVISGSGIGFSALAALLAVLNL